jgi:signal transduction histidine kinase
MSTGESPSESVLLVVADIDRRLAMHAFLETAGYNVRASQSADAAIGQFSPELIVLDATDDHQAAQDILRRLREQKPASETSVLCVVSAQGSDDMQEQARALGADDCVQWPLGRAEFLWRVRSLLRWRSEGAAADSGALARVQVAELLQAQRQREQTLSLLVHDMKNPLSGVISNVEYLRTAVNELPTLDPELPSCAMDIVQGSRRLYRMVQSLLDINQSEDGLLAVDSQRVDVRELLEAAHSTCRARLRDKDMHLILSCPEQELELQGDHDMLVRLLANLLDNAISATSNGGTIELSAEEKPGVIELRVKDQGPSLPASERVRLQSDALTPLRNSRARRGLGLRACRVLAEAHGGKLSLEEHAPRGATVCVQLPVN